jgi:hypothetical protein
VSPKQLPATGGVNAFHRALPGWTECLPPAHSTCHTALPFICKACLTDDKYALHPCAMTAATTPTPSSAADRRAGFINWIAIMAFFASYLAARLLVRNSDVPSLGRFLLCLLPAATGGFVVWRIVQFVRSLSDELERRIQLEAFALAFPAGTLASLALGFVDWSGLVHIAPWDYWFFHLPMYFLGLALARRRYA